MYIRYGCYSYLSCICWWGDCTEYWAYLKSVYKKPFKVVAEHTKAAPSGRMDRLLTPGHRRKGYEE